MLAEVLYRNHEDLGAAFELTTADSSLRLTGEVDWSNGAGHAMVAAIPADPTFPAEVYWRGGIVYERIPARTSEAFNATGKTVEFFDRPADPQHRRFDALLALISSLAAEQPDNALLVQQNGATHVSEATVDGEPVAVFGAENGLYWVNGVGELVRYQKLTNGEASFTVDLADRGRKAIAVPSPRVDPPETDSGR